MVTLRILQALLLLTAVLGLWYANRMRHEVDKTARVVTLVAISALSLVGTQGLSLAWLSLSGIEAPARVTGLNCEPGQKQHVQFEFSVEGRTVSGIESVFYGPESCDSLRASKHGSVTYVPDAPEIHAWGSFERHVGEYMAMLAVIAAVAPFMAYVSVRRLRRAEA